MFLYLKMKSNNRAAPQGLVAKLLIPSLLAVACGQEPLPVTRFSAEPSERPWEERLTEFERTDEGKKILYEAMRDVGWEHLGNEAIFADLSRDFKSRSDEAILAPYLRKGYELQIVRVDGFDNRGRPLNEYAALPHGEMAAYVTKNVSVWGRPESDDNIEAVTGFIHS